MTVTTAGPRVLLEREPQLEALSELFSRARAGSGQLAFVSGEAGAGKKAPGWPATISSVLAKLNPRRRGEVAHALSEAAAASQPAALRPTQLQPGAQAGGRTSPRPTVTSRRVARQS